MSQSTRVASSSEAPFVGRERQLSRLFAAFEVVRMGRTVAVYVSGPSGIGKTALVQRFLAELRHAEAALLLAGRCYEREVVPYKALEPLIKGLAQHLGGLPDEDAAALLPAGAGALARLFPSLEQVAAVRRLPAAAAETPDPQERRLHASKALRELLDRLTRRRPVVLVMDDMHWGDPDSGLLLAELMQPPDPPPLLLIGSYRNDLAGESPILKVLLDERAGDGPVTDVRGIELDPLSEDEAVQLVGALVGGGDAQTSNRARVVAREAGGNPFLVGELVRRWRRGEATRTQELTLESLLADRLAGLTAPARALLEVLVVAGRPIAPSLAGEAARLGGDVAAALASLREEQLVRSAGGRDGERVEIYHGRLRDALLAGLGTTRSSALHRRLAEGLEASGTPDAETQLYHLLGAGEHGRAAVCAAALGRQAAEALAFEQAAALYRQALELAETGARTDAEVVRGWRVALAEALVNAGRGAEAARVFLEAAGGAGDEAAQELERRAAEQLLRTGHVDEGLALLERVLGDLGLDLPGGPRRAVVGLLLRQAWLRLRGLRFQPRDAADLPRETLARIDACWSGAIGLGLVDSIRGAELQARGLQMALRAGEPYRIARSLAIEAAYQASAGSRQRRRARRLEERVSELVETSGHPHAEGLALLARGMTEFFDGRWQAARQFCDAAEEQLRERCVGAAWEMNAARIFGMGARYYMGQVADLCERVPRLLKEQEDRGDLFASASLRADVPNIVWLVSDEPAQARRELEEVMAAWSTSGFHIQHYWRLLAETRIDLYAGEGARAFERVQSRWRLLRRSLLLRVQPVRIFSRHLRARSALAAARRSSEPWLLLAVARREARRLLRERMPMVDGLAHLVEAGVVMAQGDPEKARALLERAIKELEEVRMLLFRAAAEWRLGELVGGDEGAAHLRLAEDFMRRERIRQPARMTDMLAPGSFSGRR